MDLLRFYNVQINRAMAVFREKKIETNLLLTII
jgi:hypothetical protein